MALGFRLAQLQPLVLTWGVNYLMEDFPPYLSSSLYIHFSIKKKNMCSFLFLWIYTSSTPLALPWFFLCTKIVPPKKKSSIFTSFIKFSCWRRTFCVEHRRDGWSPLKPPFAVSNEMFFVGIPGLLLHALFFFHASFSLSTFAPLPFPFPLKMSFPLLPPHYHPLTSPPAPSPSAVRCPEGLLTCARGTMCR